VQQASYNITGTVATPTMNPAGGTYQTSQSVVISCSTAGVTIRYTIDGSDPTDTSMIYANPIICPLDSYTLIKARAYKQDWLPSPIANSSYWITGTVATPSFDPSGGTYIGAQTVTISCATPGAQIRYTTDGTMPTVTSFLYTAPLAVNTTTTLKKPGDLRIAGLPVKWPQRCTPSTALWPAPLLILPPEIMRRRSTW